MPPQDSRCLFSLEQECQTTVEATDGAALIPEALASFLEILGRLAPSLPGEGGLFNAYGRVPPPPSCHPPHLVTLGPAA